MSLGVLFVAHGTRNVQGITASIAFAGEVMDAAARQMPELLTVPRKTSFLELASPTIAEGVAELVGRGVRQLIVVPLLLLSAGHVKRDIPLLFASARREHPQLSVILTSPLDDHPRLIGIHLDHLRDYPSSTEFPHARIFVSRGSQDVGAYQPWTRLMESVRVRSPITPRTFAFLAGWGTSLTDALTRVNRAGYRQAVIVPHLLFPGRLADSVQQTVAVIDSAEGNGFSRIDVTPLLFEHPATALAFADLLVAAVQRTP